MHRCWWAAARRCWFRWRWWPKRDACRLLVVELWWRPGGRLVQRVGRARQARPLEGMQRRRRESRAVDLVDALGRKELVEAGAKMAAALEHDRAGRSDIYAEGFELHRVHALLAVGDGRHRDAAAFAQRRQPPRSRRAPRSPAAPHECPLR